MRLPNYQALSKEQDKAVSLPLDGSYLVFGPPGCGKTVVALYRAQMLAKRGRKAQLLMHSRLLSQYTAEASDLLDIESRVTTFHSWLWTFFKRTYRISAPSLGPYKVDWQSALEIVNDSPAPTRSMEDLIVDEGQDLPKEFYILAQLVAGNVTVFADENQRITETNSTLDQIRQYGGYGDGRSHKLSRNYRNTREIAALAAHFYTGLSSGIPDLPDRGGELPTARNHRNLSATIELIRNYERANSDQQIGVFTRTKKLQRRIVRELEDTTVNPVQAYVRGPDGPPRLDFTQPGVYVVNYPSTKGLEFDAVFLPALDEIWIGDEETTTRMQMYVLTSRARDRLYLCYSGSGRPPILRDVPDELVEWD